MFEDGALTKTELVKFVCLSMTQVDRLEKGPEKFPARVLLSGAAPNSKVCWCRRSVVQWLQARDPNRHGRPDPPPMKWSDSKYGIAIEEDYHGEETQAGRGRCEVATG